MRRVSPLRLIFTGLAVAATALVASSGCADNESSMFIVGVMAPEGDDCVFEAERDTVTLGSGLLDLAVARTYTMPLLIGNQLIARGDSDKLRTETARISLRGAVVTVLPAEGDKILDEYTTNATGFVDPATGSTPGWGVSFVNGISGDLAKSLIEQIPPGSSQEVNVAVSVFGDTLGGDEVESATMTFPVFVCNECLVDCSTANPLGMGGPDCQSFPEGDFELGCFPGQDQPVPCQLAREPGEVCD